MVGEDTEVEVLDEIIAPSRRPEEDDEPVLGSGGQFSRSTLRFARESRTDLPRDRS
jgi:hypothetical protein